MAKDDGRPAGGDAAQAPSQPIGTDIKLSNRVGGEKSPFVKSKAQDAVAWQPLDNEAVELARRSNKLIFLHIGYMACHCECAWVILGLVIVAPI